MQASNTQTKKVTENCHSTTVTGTKNYLDLTNAPTSFKESCTLFHLMLMT